MAAKSNPHRKQNYKSSLAFGLFTFLCLAGIISLFSQTQMQQGHADGADPAVFGDPGSISPGAIGDTLVESSRAGADIDGTDARESEKDPNSSDPDNTDAKDASGKLAPTDDEGEILRLR